MKWNSNPHFMAEWWWVAGFIHTGFIHTYMYVCMYVCMFVCLSTKNIHILFLGFSNHLTVRPLCGGPARFPQPSRSISYQKSPPQVLKKQKSTIEKHGFNGKKRKKQKKKKVSIGGTLFFFANTSNNWERRRSPLWHAIESWLVHRDH